MSWQLDMLIIMDSSAQWAALAVLKPNWLLSTCRCDLEQVKFLPGPFTTASGSKMISMKVIQSR